MKKKQLGLVLVLVLVLGLLCAGFALAESDSLKFNMELSSSKFTEPKTITVSITVTNTGESDLPGPVTLYYPSGKQVEEFGSPTLTVGASKNWSGPWTVTQKELEAGKISFIVRYSVYDENGELQTPGIYLTKRIQYTGAEPELSVNRSIVPLVAQEGQEVSVIYEITNNGSADVSAVTIKENSSISKESGSIDGIPAGETGKYVFTVKMGKKDLTSAATISYKAGGKTYTSKVDTATIKYGKVNLSATLSADKKGGAPGDIVKLTLKLKNSGNTDFTDLNVTDETLGTVFSGQTVKAGETLSLEKDLTITETQELLFKVSADDGAGGRVETATGTVKVIATDPTQQIVLKVSASADRDSVYTIPGGIVRFTVTVQNESAVDVNNITVKAVDQTLYTFATIPAGESRSFTRDTEISMAGSFQFSANAKDQLGQTVSFVSNIIPIAYAAPTAVPTATPVITPVAPVQLTYPPAPDPEGSDLKGLFGLPLQQVQNILLIVGLVLVPIALVLLALLLVGMIRRIHRKSQSNKAMDHLEGGAYRDYGTAPKRGRRSEITNGPDEGKAADAGQAPEESTAQDGELMAETLRRLYTKQDEAAETVQQAEAEAEGAAEAVQKAAEAVQEAGETAAEAAEEVAEDAVQAVEATEAAHRRRAKKS